MKVQTKTEKVLKVIAWGSLVFLVLNCLIAFAYYLCSGVHYASLGRPVTFFDAFYFAMVTFLTIGYGDIVPVSAAAKSIFFIQGFLGLILPPVFSGLLFYFIIKRPRNVFLSEHIFIRYLKHKYLLSVRVGNQGAGLANVQGNLELFHYRGSTRRRIYHFVKDYPLLEERWYFDIKLQDPTNRVLLQELTRAVVSGTEISLRFTLSGTDIDTGETVVIFRYYHAKHIRFGKEFKQIYEWENGKKVRFHWDNFETIDAMEPELIAAFKTMGSC